jgi:tetratricopeptide (TPR) repeat protein
MQVTRLRRGILDQIAQRVRKDLSAQPKIEADLLEILGEVYLDVGDVVNAEAAYREALRLRRKVLGGNHPDVARSLNHLGDVLRPQEGKAAEAEALHREASAILARLPAEQLAAAITLHYLAWALERQDKYKEAETVHREALALRQKLLSDESPPVADSFHEVGGALEHQRRYADAEMMYHSALERQKKSLGDHRDTAHTLDHLGQLFENRSQPGEAENYYRQALALRPTIMARRASRGGEIAGLLGSILARQGRFSDAENCFREALAMRRKLFGEHEDVVRSLEDLGKLRLRQCRLDEAEANLGEALQIQTKLLGGENLKVTTALCRLGHLHRAKGHLDKAEMKFCEALRLRTMHLGRTHPSAVDARNELGEVLEARGKLAEAEANYREALDLSVGFQGDRRLILAETLDHLAHLLTQGGPSSEAESFARVSLKIRQQLRPDEWWTWRTSALLGHALAGQKRSAEAEQMLLLGYEGMTQREATIPAPCREHLRDALAWIVQLYEAKRDTAQAAVWKQRLGDAQPGMMPQPGGDE